jgi:NADH-quinone oxidoreductase subunit N
MSLVYGMTGSLSLPGIADAINSPPGLSPLLAAGLLLALATLVFKLAAFPLHFWCPDVFEAAPTEVTAFLSVASKSAAVCLVVRVLMSFAGSGLAEGAIVLAVLGLMTSTWGNLLAMRQERIKRLLAFSSVAHAGYLIMASSIILVTGQGSADAIPGAVLFYLLVYAMMNLGAFGVVSILETTPRGSTQIDLKSLDGLASAQPWLAVLMSVFLVGLMGLPGLGGFVAKFVLLRAVIEPYPGLIGVAVIAAVLINAMMGLYAYLRPIYHMALMPSQGANPRGEGGILALPGAWAVIIFCALGMLWTGVMPDGPLTLTSDFGTLRTAIAPVHHVPLAPLAPVPGSLPPEKSQPEGSPSAARRSQPESQITSSKSLDRD